MSTHVILDNEYFRVLERIAKSQESIAESLKLIRQNMEAMSVEATAQTDYLLRSEERTKHINSLTGLYYSHSFKRDGFDVVTSGDLYRTVPVDKDKWKADNEELREAGERMQKALENFVSVEPKAP